ncbi:dsDNA-mimic protein [Psychrobacter sp. FDAARGOS_221]|uniref:anti-sigma factor family protein n=1 Tax=Psychrobacter sp. FDAARGOS_221 TaxID=1975705 RepID=UPI000BB5942F|nr:dsDNA-mimic protein [Psychrobacter sp. FDAARGOS_221]PNK60932.1 dsDNA-mimic protein [Psychrobacter sp. FDAARGOS_221]
MKNCLQITQLASDAHERDLRTAEKLNLHTHIMMCSGCRAYYKNSKALSAMMKEMKAQEDSPTTK